MRGISTNDLVLLVLLFTILKFCLLVVVYHEQFEIKELVKQNRAVVIEMMKERNELLDREASQIAKEVKDAKRKLDDKTK